MNADRCEIDHTVAWEHGGETRADNLTPLCKGHHTSRTTVGGRPDSIPTA
jgi:hypothetical protein